jgi:hypothetical protein
MDKSTSIESVKKAWETAVKAVTDAVAEENNLPVDEQGSVKGRTGLDMLGQFSLKKIGVQEITVTGLQAAVLLENTAVTASKKLHHMASIASQEVIDVAAKAAIALKKTTDNAALLALNVIAEQVAEAIRKVEENKVLALRELEIQKNLALERLASQVAKSLKFVVAGVDIPSGIPECQSMLAVR